MDFFLKSNNDCRASSLSGVVWIKNGFIQAFNRIISKFIFL